MHYLFTDGIMKSVPQKKKNQKKTTTQKNYNTREVFRHRIA